MKRRVFLGAVVAAAGFAGAAETLPPAPPPAEPKTVITSRIVRVVDKGRAVEFTGDVKLTRGDDFLSADRLVTEERNTIAQAWGRVYLRRNLPAESAQWESWGDQGVYDTQTASGTIWGLEGPARATRGLTADRAPDASVFLMEAPEITFFEVGSSSGPTYSAKLAEGRGGVYLRSVEGEPRPRETELWAERAAYDGAQGWLALEGAFRPWPGRLPPGAPPPGLDRPYARQRTGREVRELRGRTIDFQPEEKRLKVRTEVWSRLLFEPDRKMGKMQERFRSKDSDGPAR